FVISDSVAYLSGCKEKYDLIFLDGNHSAVSVYNEVPLALKLLNPNGVILLHDYFPKMKPLWSDGVVIPGPYLAIKRFTGEKVNFSVLEFGELPWPTKLESNFTSLALLLRKS
ncbi:MAG TPA: class I SAM-dependent methyltransferase, partial [Chitinophagaceae bacterium]|nr:class I SAM-dependent methyltransferase [Chitinophagaceae bacterium]